MARPGHVAISALGSRGLWLRVAAAFSLAAFTTITWAQVEALPLLEAAGADAWLQPIATKAATEQTYLTPDGWLIPDSQDNLRLDGPGVIPAQFQSGLAQLQPGLYSTGVPSTANAPAGALTNPNPPPMVPEDDDWDWRLLPTSVMYSSYWAAPKEPRFSGVHFFNAADQLIEEGELGARFGLLRYGTSSDTIPQGWEWDVEGAAFPRLLPYDTFDMQSCDYRIGTDVAYGIGPWRFRFGYYHLSSHVADEYMLQHPEFVRVRYKRETLIWGISNYLTDWARVYFECGCAFDVAGQAKPLEFSFGTDLGTTLPTGLGGAPFAALSVYLRQEVDFGGDFVAQVGWLWRDKPFGHVFRVGFQFLTGYNPQNEFYRDYEQQYGLGLWYDF